MPLLEPGLEQWIQGVLSVSSEPREDGQWSLSASPIQSPVSGTWRESPYLSLHLHPHDTPVPARAGSRPSPNSSSSTGQSCPTHSWEPLPWDGVGSHPSILQKPVSDTPVGDAMPPAAQSKGTEGSASSSCGAKGWIWPQVRVAQLILEGKSIRFSLNNSEGAFSSVPLTLRKSSRLAQLRSGAFLGFSFPFAASVALPEVKRFGKAAGGNGKVQ